VKCRGSADAGCADAGCANSLGGGSGGRGKIEGYVDAGRSRAGGSAA
jgi:hypothetical protein